jgi:TatD DNase family protein
MNLVDCHNHLQDTKFAADLPPVLERARAAGVRYFFCNASCPADWPDVQRLASTHSDIISFFGLHPWYVGEKSESWLAELEQLLLAIPSGIGEIGLDRWLENSDDAAQEEVFRLQLRLAQKLSRPATIHCVQAWGALCDILKKEWTAPLPFCLHAYGGSVELIEPLAEMGAFFSFAGSVLREKNERAKHALAAVSANRLLLETDAPDIVPPRAFQVVDSKERNEPANLAGIYKGVAQLRGITQEELAAMIYDNAKVFLKGVRQL